ncbi:tripartite tricarboxylate transporter TctB family protein [Marinactinospora thermotolerans]|uniref:Putative tricarboxylic transport membrane protein n=1 Tax=Marinactinospora thermotolerans DSM 45154 TaxID=1122192 RepID=A0A1T4P4U1_9ACTN|nr:tripartite tricarboxylate transporter TctB family protein [Marinactinospora thermotolerans]SJZ86276.1 putative tricarboxylic transport membrane protein [Marinactinospora thermotolerans DSM 45154]
MSTETTTGATSAPAPTRERSWWSGRSELFVAALVIAIAAVLGVQTALMDVPPGTASPGPRFFPTIVTVIMAGVGVALAVQVIRRPADRPGLDETAAADAGDSAPAEARTDDSGGRTQWRPVLTVIGSLVVFILLLQPVGWLLSGALLFFGVVHAMGGRRPLLDATVALVFSSFVQLAFVAGLGLNLPAGILGGIF